MGVRFGPGQRVHGPHVRAVAARHVPDGTLTAIALGTRAPRLAGLYGLTADDSGEALLARDDVDAVIVATPHSTHLPLTRDAAAAGKHVYLEKPMALDVAECDAMIAACADAGVRLTVNKVTRYRQVPRTAKRLLDEAAIGELRMVRVTSSVEAYLPDETGWTRDPARAARGWTWAATCSMRCAGSRVPRQRRSSRTSGTSRTPACVGAAWRRSACGTG